MEIMQLEYYSIRETLKDGNHQRTYLLNMNTLKNFKITNKHTENRPEKFVFYQKYFFNNC